MQTRLDPFALLERADKWYLGGGKAAMYAPAFPGFLDTPGFWDESYFADIRLERLFCLLLLDEQGRPLTLRRALRRWTPDRLTLLYTVEGHPALRVQEERTVTPNDTLACRLTLTNSGALPLRLHLILWSLQTQRTLPADEFATTVEAVEQEPDALTFAHRVHYGRTADTPADVYGWGESTPSTIHHSPGSPNHFGATNHRIFVALGASRTPDSWTVNLAENSDTSPLWQVSILPEKFRAGELPREMKAEVGWNPNGMLHLALHYAVDVRPGISQPLTFGAALALERAVALRHLHDDLAHNVCTRSRAHWQGYFASVPHFTCSDPYLERYYWYRWYGLRLLTVDVGAGQLPHPCIFEGIGAFRSHITYSAQCHLRETSWMHSGAVATGCLANFLANQVQQEDQAGDGFVPGHLYLWRRDRGFYHANWGAAAKQYYDLTGDLDFVRHVYPGLLRYAEYFDRERDREGIGLYDVVDQGETGQEYMSRYLFVDRAADAWRPIQVKGVDATCYLYELQRALAYFARALGDHSDASWWDEKAEATRQAVRALMWDGDDGWYKDVHPQTLVRSPYKAAVGFYPFMSDIATTLQLPAMRAHLHDPSTFGTSFPVPASSADDPHFAADAEWKGKRTNCPWNGRVWPMTNSHVADALANVGRTLSADFRAEAADFMTKYVGMLFHNGDPKRPNCFEHYNPDTGTPSLYRGVDDYQHSWIVDLILRHVVGIQPEPGEDGALVIDPLPFELDRFYAADIRVRGRRIDVDWNRASGFTVIVDGKVRASSPQRTRLEIPLG
jgi:hypothetical protein